MSPTTAMSDIIMQILVEVLKIFGIATKEIKRGTTSGFLDQLSVIKDRHLTAHRKVPEEIGGNG